MPKRFLIIAAIGLLIFVGQGIFGERLFADTEWQRLETRYTVIFYRSKADLKKFNTKIKYSRTGTNLRQLLSNQEAGMAQQIKGKVDAIFERVQEILDMRKKIKKVKIKLYPDRSSIHAACRKIFKKPCRFRAWYIFEYHTIYLNLNDLHAGMLAHETAHAVIDHYLTVRPPPASAEILARYVDSHLRRK